MPRALSGARSSAERHSRNEASALRGWRLQTGALCRGINRLSRSGSNPSCSPAGVCDRRPRRAFARFGFKGRFLRGARCARCAARTPGRRGPAKEKHRFPLFKARRCLSAFCAVQKRCGSLAAPPKLGCLVPGVAFCGNNRGVSVIVRVFWLAKRS